MGLEFAKIFTEPESGRQIVAVRRDLRNFGPSVVFTTKMEDGRYMDRIYYTEPDDASVAALDQYFEELTVEIANYQVAKTIVEFGITGETGDKPAEIEGGPNSTSGAAERPADGNPEDA